MQHHRAVDVVSVSLGLALYTTCSDSRRSLLKNMLNVDK